MCLNVDTKFAIYMVRDLVPFPMIIFYYGERAEKLCLNVDIKLLTMHPGNGMMAYFSISVPNKLFNIENMGRGSVPCAIIIFCYFIYT